MTCSLEHRSHRIVHCQFHRSAQQNLIDIHIVCIIIHRPHSLNRHKNTLESQIKYPRYVEICHRMRSAFEYRKSNWLEKYLSKSLVLHFMTSNRSGLVLVYSISICRIRHCYLRIVFVVNANFPMSTSSAASTAFVACGGISDRTEQLCNGNQEKLIMKFAL